MSESDRPARRVMLVHAHPDDESSSTGALMARYAADGAGVTLVTCTLGERGAIVVPELEHLAIDRDGGLADYRIGELDTALRALGVTDAVRLGGDGRWQDTGMIDTPGGLAAAPPDAGPETFWRADLREAADELVALIRDRRPHVLVTYDELGFYGHPDHVQAHRVATYAVALAAEPSYRLDLGTPWQVQRVLWIAISASQMRAMIDAGRRAQEQRVAAGEPASDAPFAQLDPDELPPMATPDERVAVRIDGYPYREQRFAALRAHATQIKPDEFFFAFEDAPPGPSWDECYRLAAGTPPPAGATDVFAGLPLDG